MEVQAERLTGVYKNMNLGVVTLAFRCKLVGGKERPTSGTPLHSSLGYRSPADYENSHRENIRRVA